MKLERGGGSQNEKPTRDTYGKRHYGKCLAGTSGFYGCGKYDHNVRFCPTIAVRGREGKQVPPNIPNNDAPNKRRFYELRTKGLKSDEDEELW